MNPAAQLPASRGHVLQVTALQGPYQQAPTGAGEAVDAIGGGASIIAGFRNALIGADPLNVEAIFERLRTWRSGSSGAWRSSCKGLPAGAVYPKGYWDVGEGARTGGTAVGR